MVVLAGVVQGATSMTVIALDHRIVSRAPERFLNSQNPVVRGTGLPSVIVADREPDYQRIWPESCI